MKVLVVIDMQNDLSKGTLVTRELAAYFQKLQNKFRNFQGRYLTTGTTMERISWKTKEGRI